MTRNVMIIDRRQCDKLLSAWLRILYRSSISYMGRSVGENHRLSRSVFHLQLVSWWDSQAVQVSLATSQIA